MSLRLADKDTTILRFAVGDRVECNCGKWMLGTVVKLFYVQSTFKEGMCAPYQVKLDDGKLIFAPMDTDRVVRAATPEALAAAEEEDDFYDEEIPDAEKLPVTVITGFLGSGKTTLINHILTEKHGVRVCVIENEFGSVDIDTSLVKENMQVAEEIISLDNGCACCTVRGDLVKAMKQLQKRKADFDMVLVETTGLANPAPVVATFTQDPAICNNFRVDGIVCLVDSKHIGGRIADKKADDAVNEAVCQIAFADRILLNKIDLVKPEELRELKETISSINAYAELYETERSKVAIDKLLGISAFSIERMNASLDEFDIDVADPVKEAKEDASHGHGHDEGPSTAAGHEHGHAEPGKADDCDMCVADDDGSGGGSGGASSSAAHMHDHQADVAAPAKKRTKKHDLSGVGSLGLTASTPLISAQFNAFMSDLLRRKSLDLYRSKGVLAFVEEGDSKFIFQGVHEQIQYTTAVEPWGADEPRVSKVVFIGRDLDHDELRAGWAKCQSGAPKEEKAAGFLSSLLG